MLPGRRGMATESKESSPEDMQLTLSSEALPSSSIANLRRGARRRDLDGVEWVVRERGEQGYRDRFGGSLSEEWGREEATPAIQWLVLRTRVSVTELLYWSRQAHLLEAGLVLRQTKVESPLCVPLAVQHPTDAEAAHRAAAWARMHRANTCWNVELDAVTEGEIEDVLDVTAATLGHIRLRGAGPEAPSGPSAPSRVGPLLKELALRGFSGTVALAPSDRGKEKAWREWVFRDRGWGCNTVANRTAAQ